MVMVTNTSYNKLNGNKNNKIDVKSIVKVKLYVKFHKINLKIFNLS